MRRFWSSVIVTAILSGGVGCAPRYDFEFAQPDGAGTFFSDGYIYDKDRAVFRSDGSAGFALATEVTGGNMRMQAGLLPGSSAGAPVTTGSAVYSGDWRLIGNYTYDPGIGEKDRSRGFSDSGNITLNADFDAGTLTGQSGKRLSVSGKIAGHIVSGDVDYAGVITAKGLPLSGLIGDERAVGVFGGTGPDGKDWGIAGGFLVAGP